MYERIVTVAQQCGTVTVSALRAGIIPPAPPPTGPAQPSAVLSVRLTADGRIGPIPPNDPNRPRAQPDGAWHQWGK